jgi:hypothetical protein
MKQKIIWTIATMLLGYVIFQWLSPVASLLSNQATVGQLANSDSSSLVQSAVGNGQNLVTLITIGIECVSLYFIWK